MHTCLVLKSAFYCTWKIYGNYLKMQIKLGSPPHCWGLGEMRFFQSAGGNLIGLYFWKALWKNVSISLKVFIFIHSVCFTFGLFSWREKLHTKVLSTKMSIIEILKRKENNYSNLKCPIMSIGYISYNSHTLNSIVIKIFYKSYCTCPHQWKID